MPIVPNIYLENKNFIFSKTIATRRINDKQIAELRESELWGCWDYLSASTIVLLDLYKFYLATLKQDVKITSIFIEPNKLYKIKNSIYSEINSFPQRTQEMEKYKLYTSRIHNHLRAVFSKLLLGVAEKGFG